MRAQRGRRRELARGSRCTRCCPRRSPADRARRRLSSPCGSWQAVQAIARAQPPSRKSRPSPDVMRAATGAAGARRAAPLPRERIVREQHLMTAGADAVYATRPGWAPRPPADGPSGTWSRAGTSVEVAGWRRARGRRRGRPRTRCPARRNGVALNRARGSRMPRPSAAALVRSVGRCRSPPTSVTSASSAARSASGSPTSNCQRRCARQDLVDDLSLVPGCPGPVERPPRSVEVRDGVVAEDAGLVPDTAGAQARAARPTMHRVSLQPKARGLEDVRDRQDQLRASGRRTGSGHLDAREVLR